MCMPDEFDKKMAQKIIREYMMDNKSTGEAQDFLNKVLYDADQWDASLYTYDTVEKVNYQRCIITQKLIRMITKMYDLGLDEDFVINVCYEIAHPSCIERKNWLSPEQILFLADTLKPIKDEDKEKVKTTRAKDYFVLGSFVKDIEKKLNVNEDLAIAAASLILGTTIKDVKNSLK